jgi:pimeloyl-ACP methyl ester carboxylesterase
MGTFLYRNGGWHEQTHGIDLPQKSQESFNAITYDSPVDSFSLIKLLLEGTHHGYNKALALNKRFGSDKGSFDMSYLNHAKQLNPDDFPACWTEALFQAYLPEQISNKASLLICFTGRGGGLNMPIPCFHSLAREVFDGVAYFFDEDKDFYVANQAHVEQAVASLLELFPWKRVALLGVSGGGAIALRFPRHPLIKRRLSASPPICRDQQLLSWINHKKFDDFINSRVFFSYGNKLDTRHYRYLKAHLPAELFERSVFNLAWASESHGTLATLMGLGALTKQLEWLSNDTSPVQVKFSLAHPIYAVIMQYLSILNSIRWVTGQRSPASFPDKGCSIESFGPMGTGSGVLFVYDTAIGKSILESADFGQYNFIERAVALTSEEQTAWIRRFCAESPVMLDGTMHQEQRRELTKIFQCCSDALRKISADMLASTIVSAASVEGFSSLSIAEVIIEQLFDTCLTEITGDEVAIPAEELFAVDFFNPFPKPSTLRRCDRAIRICMEAVQWQKLSKIEVLAVSTLLIMGVSPLLAVVTKSINALLECMSPLDDSMNKAVRACRSVDFYNTVPTNFVIRRCLKPTQIQNYSLAKDDWVYVFLGSANGCPFSRLHSIPFGAGRHICSGTKLSADMLSLTHDALELAAPALKKSALLCRRSPTVEGRASAFLTYARSQSDI